MRTGDVRHKQVRPLDLHRSRDASHEPIADALSTAMAFLVSKEFRDPGRATQTLDCLSVRVDVSRFVHKATLNTMFISNANAAFNNKAFTSQTMWPMRAIHETAQRLYAAAKQLRDVEGPANVARLLNESPQLLNNWERRGMSAAGALKAASALGCRAEWLRTGEGEMVDAGGLKESLRGGKISKDQTDQQKSKPLPAPTPAIQERAKAFVAAFTEATTNNQVSPELMTALEGMLAAGTSNATAAAFAKRSRSAIRAAMMPEGQPHNEVQKRGSTR